MDGTLLVCLRFDPYPCNLIDLNAKYRWCSIRHLGRVNLVVSGKPAERECFAIGDSHGEYNGCLGPPPQIFTGNRRRIGSGGTREIYVAGARIGPDEAGDFISILAGDQGCFVGLKVDDAALARWCHNALKKAPHLKTKEAIQDWPYLITEGRAHVIIKG